MSKIAYIAAGCGVALIVWGVAFLRHTPLRSQPIQATSTLQERWEDLDGEVAPLVKGPRIIPTTKIIPEPVAEVKEPVAKPIPVKQESKRTRVELCRAHGMRRVYVSKYKWRCKK